ncbi:hypothetical protein [Streptomyces sp. NPDC093591]|uniref:hypothetical protein n=1 Tax=Streptomyces sp. NPDC093591 TaxID=3366044 RepID=UPI003828CB96
MSKAASNQHANGLAPQQTPEESLAAPESDLPRYRVELESPDEGIRRVEHVHAGSMEEALVKVRETDHWPSSGPGSDPSGFRVVEATEESASSEARHQRNARRRYINTIVEEGLAALGKTAPDRPDQEFLDVLSDFFTRAVVHPGHFAFPSGDTEADRLLEVNDVSCVLVELLTTHLTHHGLKVERAVAE